MENSNTETPGNKTEVIIVTGSSGMIGSALIHKLAKKYHVLGFDHDGYPLPTAESECVGIELTGDARRDFAFKIVRYAYGNKIAAVVHLAAYYDFLDEPSDLYDKVTVKGTERMLKYLHDFEVEQLLID
jgi:nucleoside-diphosphate-sugar epimerase